MKLVKLDLIIDVMGVPSSSWKISSYGGYFGPGGLFVSNLELFRWGFYRKAWAILLSCGLLTGGHDPIYLGVVLGCGLTDPRWACPLICQANSYPRQNVPRCETLSMILFLTDRGLESVSGIRFGE